MGRKKREITKPLVLPRKVSEAVGRTEEGLTRSGAAYLPFIFHNIDIGLLKSLVFGGFLFVLLTL